MRKKASKPQETHFSVNIEGAVAHVFFSERTDELKIILVHSQTLRSYSYVETSQGLDVMELKNVLEGGRASLVLCEDFAILKSRLLKLTLNEMKVPEPDLKYKFLVDPRTSDYIVDESKIQQYITS